MKKFKFACLMLAGVALFTGCSKQAVDNEPKEIPVKTEKKVENTVDEISGGETYELISKEIINEKAGNVMFTFKSDKRDLSYSAVSYLDPDITGDKVSTSVIKNDYLYRMSNLYYDKIREKIVSSPIGFIDEDEYTYGRGMYMSDDPEYFSGDYPYDLDLVFPALYITISDESEIDKAASLLASAGEIYEKEAVFHEDGYCIENPVCGIKIFYGNSENMEDLGNIMLMGTSDKSFYLEKLSKLMEKRDAA